MKRGWRRWVSIPLLLAALVLTTAGGCDPGYVKSREWREDARGFKICDLTIQPNSTSDPAFKLKGLSEKTCNKCPPGAKWPDCGKAKDKKDSRPAPPKETKDWDQGTPAFQEGQPCLVEGMGTKDAAGIPMRCRDGKWKHS